MSYADYGGWKARGIGSLNKDTDYDDYTSSNPNLVTVALCFSQKCAPIVTSGVYRREDQVRGRDCKECNSAVVYKTMTRDKLERIKLSSRMKVQNDSQESSGCVERPEGTFRK